MHCVRPMDMGSSPSGSTYRGGRPRSARGLWMWSRRFLGLPILPTPVPVLTTTCDSGPVVLQCHYAVLRNRSALADVQTAGSRRCGEGWGAFRSGISPMRCLVGWTALGQPDGKPVFSTNYWRHRPSWSGLPRFWQPTKSAACQEPKQLTPQHKNMHTRHGKPCQ